MTAPHVRDKFRKEHGPIMHPSDIEDSAATPAAAQILRERANTFALILRAIFLLREEIRLFYSLLREAVLLELALEPKVRKHFLVQKKKKKTKTKTKTQNKKQNEKQKTKKQQKGKKSKKTETPKNQIYLILS